MRKTLQVLAALFALLLISGFASIPQASGATLVVLDRSGQPVTRITDGDSIRLRLSLPAAVTNSQTYTFRLDDLSSSVGTCEIASGSSCETDAFAALGWHWDAG